MRIRRRAFEAWLHDLRVGWGDRAARTAGSLVPLLADGRNSDLRSLGARLAAEGHALDAVLAWFDLLARHSRQFRGRLERGGIVDLAAGWADGALRGDDRRGAAPFDMLRLRLREQVALTGRMGGVPGRHLALVVAEADGEIAATAPALVEHARRVFDSGETVALAPNGKLLVLVQRGHEARGKAVEFGELLRNDQRLADVAVRVWVEPLAMSADHVDAHLLELAG